MGCLVWKKGSTGADGGGGGGGGGGCSTH